MFTYNSEVVKDNIAEIWDQHTSSDYNQGKQWYREANQFCSELAEKFQTTPVKTAGVLSALSPLKEWGLNKRITEDFFEVAQTAPLSGWKRASHYFTQKRKAQLIFMASNPTTAQIDGVLGGLKTINFFNCINNPSSSDHVCIDRHMIRVAGVDNRSLTEKQYLFLQKEYLNFANKVGMIPCHAQAILWVAYKRVKNV